MLKTGLASASRTLVSGPAIVFFSGWRFGRGPGTAYILLVLLPTVVAALGSLGGAVAGGGVDKDAGATRS